MPLSNMNATRFLIKFFIFAFANICEAQIIDEITAKSTAINFLNDIKANKIANSSNKIPANNNYELTYKAIEDDKVCFYVYNCSTGGFVIVSADDRSEKPVLGYSTSGIFNYSNLEVNTKTLLDSYKNQILALESAPKKNVSQQINKQAESSNKAVAPLLGETAWAQGSPYNLMCPIIDGNHCVTGCVATAMAQIMYYHKWPEKGNGNILYQSENFLIESDLRESEYLWDLMLPTYNYDSDLDSQLAVALLMRDCGYSVETSYGLTSSGAIASAYSLWQNFNYDKSMTAHLAISYDLEEWDELIREEIDNNRPVLFSGGSHAYVCDGYDENGYFHFNFGWSGSCNGYYLCSANGYSDGQDIICGIQKDYNGVQTISFDAAQSFMYSGQDRISFNSSITTTGKDWIQCYTAFENLSNSNISLLKGENTYTFSSAGIRNFGFKFSGIDLEDGQYIVYPVVKLLDSTSSDFIKCHFRSDMQSYVNLTVENGVMNYSNESENNLTDGMVKVDGLYYIINEVDKTASVTITEDMKGSYSGSIIIPDSIELGGDNYNVTSIEEEAFMDCMWMDITIGSNIETIGKNAFRNTYVRNIIFASNSKLQYIGDYAFLSHLFENSIEFPEGLISIGTECFNLESTTEITLPSTLKEIGKNAFRSSDRLRDITVRHNVPLEFKHSIFSFDNNGDIQSKVNLYVPQGSKNLYQMTKPWSDFNIIDGIPSKQLVEINNNDFILYKPTMTATMVKLSAFEDINNPIPEFITYDNEKYTLKVIDDAAVKYNGNGDVPSLVNLYIPYGISELRESAFRDQDKLKTIDFSEDSELWYIGSMCFESTAIESIIFPSNLMVIDVYAFYDCSDLKMVYIPASVVRIGQDAFSSCVSLQDVYVRWQNPLKVNVMSFNNCNYSQMRLHVPVGTIENYQNTPPWSYFGEIIEDDLVGIDQIIYENKPFYNIYNAQGILLKRNVPSEDFDTLESGLYIINGKKILIR